MAYMDFGVMRLEPRYSHDMSQVCESAPTRDTWQRAAWAIQHQTVDLPAQQALWAAGVAEYATEFGVRIDLRVLAPVVFPGDGTTVVPRPWVHVVPDDPADLKALRSVCASVWRRAIHLDADGEPNDALDSGDVSPPSIREGGVLIDFDTLDDVNPWPSKARECLHMLLTALQRRDLTAIHVCNGAFLPEDSDYNPHALNRAARNAHTIEVGMPVPASPPARPPFLGASHRATRRGRGNPTSPVAFIHVVVGEIRAWDPAIGRLVTLPWSTTTNVSSTDRTVSSDGITLEYTIEDIRDEHDPALPPGTRPWKAPEWRRCRRDLITGQAEPLEDWPASTSDLTISRHKWIDTTAGPSLTQESRSTRHELNKLTLPNSFRQPTHHWTTVQTTQYTDHLGGPTRPIDLPPLAWSLDTLTVQWATNGQFLLATTSDQNRNRIIHLDLTTGAMKTLGNADNLLLQGSASISPDNTRCLVARQYGSDFAILDLSTGLITAIDDLLNLPPHTVRHHPLGFATTTGLITQTHAGRRIHLHYLDLETGYPHHLLDLPAGPGDPTTIQLAARVIQNNLQAFGPASHNRHIRATTHRQ